MSAELRTHLRWTMWASATWPWARKRMVRFDNLTARLCVRCVGKSDAEGPNHVLNYKRTPARMHALE